MHYIVTSIGLFIDQLTLGPLRNLVQCRAIYLASTIILLAVSTAIEGDRYSLIKFYLAGCSLGCFGEWKVFLLRIPAYITYRAGQLVERKAK